MNGFVLPAGDWPGQLSVESASKYLGEQIALAFTQRASGEDPARIREMLGLALSVFDHKAGEAAQ